MQANSQPLPAQSAASHPDLSRRRRSDGSLPVRIDGRTGYGRRVRELTDAYLEALGGANSVPPARMADVEAAAELKAAAEQERARYARGEAISLDDLVRLENLANRAVQRLNLPQREHEPAGDDEFSRLLNGR